MPRREARVPTGSKQTSRGPRPRVPDRAVPGPRWPQGSLGARTPALASKGAQPARFRFLPHRVLAGSESGSPRGDRRRGCRAGLQLCPAPGWLPLTLRFPGHGLPKEIWKMWSIRSWPPHLPLALLPHWPTCSRCGHRLPDIHPKPQPQPRTSFPAGIWGPSRGSRADRA